MTKQDDDTVPNFEIKVQTLTASDKVLQLDPPVPTPVATACPQCGSEKLSKTKGGKLTVWARSCDECSALFGYDGPGGEHRLPGLNWLHTGEEVRRLLKL